MTEIEVSSGDQNSRPCFPQRSITVEKDGGKERINSFALGSKEERAMLLKAGFTGKDIESKYLKHNGIIVIGINWQD